MSDQYKNQDVRSGQSKTAVNGSKMSEETITSKVKKVAAGVADNLMNKEVDLDEMMLELADKLAGTGAEQGNM